MNYVPLPGVALKLDEIREVQIELTEMCNADCPFCINRASFAREGRHSHGMKTAAVLDMLKWIAVSGVRRVRFTGGEPLLRNDFAQLAAYAKQLNLTLGVNTNGYLVERWSDVIHKYCDFILLSMISVSAEITDAVMRFPGSHAAKLLALAALSRHPNLWVSTVLSPRSIAEIPQLFDLLVSNGVSNWILLRPEANAVAGLDEYRFGKKELDDTLDVLATLPREASMNIGFGNAIPVCAASTSERQRWTSELLNRCDGGLVSEGRSKLVIDPSGNVLVHYGIPEPVGKAFEHLQVAWSHPLGARLRSEVSLPEACRSCAVLAICNGGSRLAARSVSGSFEARDPLMGNFCIQ